MVQNWIIIIKLKIQLATEIEDRMRIKGKLGSEKDRYKPLKTYKMASFIGSLIWLVSDYLIKIWLEIVIIIQ